jgi:histidinol dehydrogenase
MEKEADGVTLGQLVRPLGRVGAYVPGGGAAYPSSVLMTVLPAKVAGVPEVVLATPPQANGEVNPYTLVAARIAGADAVYKCGGAQAVAALAYGTETIPRVDKVVGPGNIYVTLAKREVMGTVGIDMLAGPSEVLVLADDSANAVYVAADLLSQAEHDELAAAYCITDSKKLAAEVKSELSRQCAALARAETAARALRQQGALVLVESIDEGMAIVNELAPEHLELHLGDPWLWLEKVQNAGAVFIGDYTPEAVGDYWAGPNHVLPTAGAARFSSPLSVDDFIKKSSIIHYPAQALLAAAAAIESMARVEGLDAHGLSVKIRRDILEKSEDC